MVLSPYEPVTEAADASHNPAMIAEVAELRAGLFDAPS